MSSDLSHYLAYDVAREIDAATAKRITRLDDGLEPERACGSAAINGLCWIARRKGLKARALDVRNSGDTAGSKDRVVGYGAFAFYEEKRLQ
jgi:AmmeMemoRadiSam system protein B